MDSVKPVHDLRLWLYHPSWKFREIIGNRYLARLSPPSRLTWSRVAVCLSLGFCRSKLWDQDWSVSNLFVRWHVVWHEDETAASTGCITKLAITKGKWNLNSQRKVQEPIKNLNSRGLRDAGELGKGDINSSVLLAYSTGQNRVQRQEKAPRQRNACVDGS